MFEFEPSAETHRVDLVGIAEIAELSGMTRQAITNMRSRDGHFPLPLAELRSGPVFSGSAVRDYLDRRGRSSQPAMAPSVQRKRTERFNPLDRINLAWSVEQALREEPLNPLAPEVSFVGSGLYCIYYEGPYEPYSQLDLETPIYVGRAVPKGARAGLDGLLSTPAEPMLYLRLREHARSLQQVESHGAEEGQPQLRLSDFKCRFLVVEDIWVPLAEALMIGHYRPLWNQVLQGFGNHDPGGGRRRGARPDWDELHPGRAWATKHDKPGRSPEESLRLIREHLAMPVGSPDPTSTPELTEDELRHLTEGDL
ncbi:Eco29kI family restriction endonuclease [Streptomyces sp. NPDC056796]|uniref:Eco29kI family restriction endonuclease n=1 Tax=Streptomyces sp. NPDC056796 TaxID=3345947 RepID=UPI00367B86B0